MSCRYCIYSSHAGKNGLIRCQPLREFKSIDAEAECAFYLPETRLYEYQGKKLLTEAGISVPRSKLARSPEEAIEAAKEFQDRVVLKAQTLMGRRGKAGLIKKANSREEIFEIAQRMFSSKHEGETIHALLVEERQNVAREFYLGLAIDVSAKKPVFILSPEGGMEIEEIARSKPQSITRVLIDPLIGLREFQTRSLVKFAKVDDKAMGVQMDRVLHQVYTAFVNFRALLIEINPLCITSEDRLIALDAKISIDEFAVRQSPALASQLYGEEHRIARESGVESHVSYAESDGEVAVLANGTSAGMAIMDLLADEGIGFSCFCDIGAVPSISSVNSALQTAYDNALTKVIFLSLNGGGLTPLTKVAEYIATYAKSHLPQRGDKPLVVRINGPGDAAGLAMLEKVGVQAYSNLSAAMREVLSKTHDHGEDVQ